MCRSVELYFYIYSRRYEGKPSSNDCVPKVFTPNSNGVNDVWEVKNLNLYPICKVHVYKRWREDVYSSIGYGIPWESTYRGAVLPSGTYYMIDLKNGF